MQVIHQLSAVLDHVLVVVKHVFVLINLLRIEQLVGLVVDKERIIVHLLLLLRTSHVRQVFERSVKLSRIANQIRIRRLTFLGVVAFATT